MVESAAVRHDWRLQEVEALFALPFLDLLFQAQKVHRGHHEPNAVQMSTVIRSSIAFQPTADNSVTLAPVVLRKALNLHTYR